MPIEPFINSERSAPKGTWLGDFGERLVERFRRKTGRKIPEVDWLEDSGGKFGVLGGKRKTAILRYTNI